MNFTKGFALITSTNINSESNEIIILNVAVYLSFHSSLNNIDNNENSVFKIIGFNYNILIGLINVSESIFSS